VLKQYSWGTAWHTSKVWEYGQAGGRCGGESGVDEMNPIVIFVPVNSDRWSRWSNRFGVGGVVESATGKPDGVD
jgi:hypothetical protein